MSFRPPLPWIVAFCEECHSRFGRFTPRHFVHALHALSCWRIDASSALMQRLLAALHPQLRAFNVGQLAATLRSLKQLGWRNGNGAPAASPTTAEPNNIAVGGVHGGNGEPHPSASIASEPSDTSLPQQLHATHALESATAARPPITGGGHHPPVQVSNARIVRPQAGGGLAFPPMDRKLQAHPQRRKLQSASQRLSQRAAGMARAINLACLSPEPLTDPSADHKQPAATAQQASQRQEFAAAFMQAVEGKLKYASAEDLASVIALAPDVLGIEAAPQADAPPINGCGTTSYEFTGMPGPAVSSPQAVSSQQASAGGAPTREQRSLQDAFEAVVQQHQLKSRQLSM